MTLAANVDQPVDAGKSGQVLARPGRGGRLMASSSRNQ
jgi:hypothetical protein